MKWRCPGTDEYAGDDGQLTPADVGSTIERRMACWAPSATRVDASLSRRPVLAASSTDEAIC